MNFAAAQQEARTLGLDLVPTERGLALTDGTLELVGDFSRLGTRIKPGKVQQELLVKAAKVKGATTTAAAAASDQPLAALDATAGMGEDSFLLAAAGFEVTLYEQDSVIAALLADTLERARADSALAPIVARMHLVCGDSVAAMQELAADPSSARPAIILLDPMFPERTKSASVKKKFQLLHHLEQPCANEDELLDAAFALRPRKVVVKRPPKGPHLSGRKPDYSLTGKAVRYDVYAFAPDATGAPDAPADAPAAAPAAAPSTAQ